MVLFSVLGWHTTKRFQYWVDIPQYVLRKRSNNKTMPQTKFSGEIDNNVHVIISPSITQVFHILATLERSRQLGVQHNMELLVVFVCPFEGVTGLLHVLRTYCLAHLLLHVEGQLVVHIKCSGKDNFVGCTSLFERRHQALILLHATPKLLQLVCSDLL